MSGDDVIERLREKRKLYEARIKQKAAEVYATFDKNERLAVRFGMLPHYKTVQAEKELVGELLQAEGCPFEANDIGRLLAAGIMDSANAGPDKMVM